MGNDFHEDHKGCQKCHRTHELFDVRRTMFLNAIVVVGKEHDNRDSEVGVDVARRSFQTSKGSHQVASENEDKHCGKQGEKAGCLVTEHIVQEVVDAFHEDFDDVAQAEATVRYQRFCTIGISTMDTNCEIQQNESDKRAHRDMNILVVHAHQGEERKVAASSNQRLEKHMRFTPTSERKENRPLRAEVGKIPPEPRELEVVEWSATTTVLQKNRETSKRTGGPCPHERRVVVSNQEDLSNSRRATEN